jgi:hypothetical protein
MEFQAIWDNIVKHQGELFRTITDLPFTYIIKGNSVVPDRTNYPISKNEFKKAYKLEFLSGPGQINNLVRGPAYVYAILTDIRIKY